jgi:hypothetical protein
VNKKKQKNFDFSQTVLVKQPVAQKNKSFLASLFFKEATAYFLFNVDSCPRYTSLSTGFAADATLGLG